MCNGSCKAAVLDWNGTIIDDLPLVYKSVKTIFSRFKLPAPSLHEYRTEMSQEWMKFYIRHGIPADTKPETLNAIRREVFEANWDSVMLHRGACELLAFLKTRGTKMFLVSGEAREILERRLTQFNLSDLFEEIYPDAYRKAEILSRLNLLPEESIYVDDDPIALTSAKELGFTTVGMTHGYASEARIRAAEPERVADNFHEVIEFVKS